MLHQFGSVVELCSLSLNVSTLCLKHLKVIQCFLPAASWSSNKHAECFSLFMKHSQRRLHVHLHLPAVFFFFTGFDGALLTAAADRRKGVKPAAGCESRVFVHNTKNLFSVTPQEAFRSLFTQSVIFSHVTE